MNKKEQVTDSLVYLDFPEFGNFLYYHPHQANRGSNSERLVENSSNLSSGIEQKSKFVLFEKKRRLSCGSIIFEAKPFNKFTIPNPDLSLELKKFEPPHELRSISFLSQSGSAFCGPAQIIGAIGVDSSASFRKTEQILSEQFVRVICEVF